MVYLSASTSICIYTSNLKCCTKTATPGYLTQEFILYTVSLGHVVTNSDQSNPYTLYTSTAMLLSRLQAM